MKKVGIRFKRTGKLSFYLTDDDNLTNNDEKDINVNINRNVEWN